MPAPTEKLTKKLTKKFNNKLLRTVKATIAAYSMFQPGDSVLVGVSGGPDSVALLHALLAFVPMFSLRLGIVHLNHSLRREDSDYDAKFVESLAEKLDLPFYMKKENVRKYQRLHKLSTEEASRRVRYALFGYISERYGFNKIALGHNSDDNAELILMYLFRGSGAPGISGIPPVRDGKIVRPLIRLRRSEITDFLASKSIDYVLDKSNTDTKFLRNKIRHNLIPVLKSSYNPKIIETLNRFSSIIQHENEWIEDITDSLFKQCVQAAERGRVTLSVKNLNREHVAAKRRIIRKAIAIVKGDLRRISYRHIEAAIDLLQNGIFYKSLDLPDRIRIKRHKEELTVSKEKTSLREFNVKPTDAASLSFEYRILKPGTLLMKEIGIKIRLKLLQAGIEGFPAIFSDERMTAFFDMDHLDFPLTLRNFRPGDRFTPLGMSGTQRVKKYFVDKKVHPADRANCPVLLSCGKIIWVVGHRIDDSVKVLPLTSQALKIEVFLA